MNRSLGPAGAGASAGARLARRRRPGRLALVGGIALSLGLAGIAAAWVKAPGLDDGRAEIRMRYSAFSPTEVVATAGVPITFVLVNADPIDHEWLVGDDAFHERHRTGTEPDHGTRPTEVSVPAGTTVTTTVTFQDPGEYRFICHLPGHEAYGMVGILRVVPAELTRATRRTDTNEPAGLKGPAGSDGSDTMSRADPVDRLASGARLRRSTQRFLPCRFSWTTRSSKPSPQRNSPQATGEGHGQGLAALEDAVVAEDLRGPRLGGAVARESFDEAEPVDRRSVRPRWLHEDVDERELDRAAGAGHGAADRGRARARIELPGAIRPSRVISGGGGISATWIRSVPPFPASV